MKLTEGTPWIISCTNNFEETVAFFRDVMGLSITEQGTPITDTQFTKYAQIQMPTGAVLEIVKPTESVSRLYTAPIFSITVDNIIQARNEMENKNVEFVAPIFHDDKIGWTYFRAPDGQIYQIQGSYEELEKDKN